MTRAPVSASGQATAPRVSIGTAARRGWRKRPPTTTSARANAASASPTRAETGRVVLSAQPSCMCVADLAEASTLVSAGSGA